MAGKKKGGLGKGLDAIFAENDMEDANATVTLKISEIEPNRAQPRKDFNDEALAELAKEALVELRQGPHPDPYYDALERELTQRVNALGVGPQGFGGKTTALSVRIKAAPTHIAGLPVAVNVGCHVTRHASAIL